ncbi:MAG TPA: hypothetical protein VLG40_04015 [Candidatus Saccharimonas sp.]|nr:hypothetical protein [Candidatus Saccharimonas sp.]
MVLDITYEQLPRRACMWLVSRLNNVDGVASVVVNQTVIRLIPKSTANTFTVFEEVRALLKPKFTFGGSASIIQLLSNYEDELTYRIELIVAGASAHDLKELAAMAEEKETVRFADVSTSPLRLRMFIVKSIEGAEPINKSLLAVARHCGVWLRHITTTLL